MNLKDKDAIKNLMETVQELRDSVKEKESEISCLVAEIEDMQQKNSELETAYSEKVMAIFPVH